MKLELNKDKQIARYDISPEGLGEINIDSSPNGEYVAYEDVSNVLASNQKLIGELVEGLENIEQIGDGDLAGDCQICDVCPVEDECEQFRSGAVCSARIAKALIAKANN
jgi:hypothetical protein